MMLFLIYIRHRYVENRFEENTDTQRQRFVEFDKKINILTLLLTLSYFQ